MPEIFIDGKSIQAERDQTVMQAALAHDIAIPYFCYHPSLSIAGNCRICAVQVEGRSWVEIACNMPVSEGLRVLTDSEQGAGLPQGADAARHAQSSGRLRHLRQGR
jgi:NADH-quinone oxidoreductase subunit G